MSKPLILLAALGAGALILAACNGNLPVAPVVAQQPAGAVSFSKDVAPLLKNKCAGCHGVGQSGAARVQIFDAAGEVVHANVAAKASETVAAVVSGRMPKGRPALSATEAGTLQKWAADGAKND
jgi:cytochrome c peroxidase